MTNFAKSAILIVFVLLISGCTTMKSNYFPMPTDISKPPTKEIVTAYVGDSLLTQGKVATHDSIFVNSDTRIGALAAYTVTRGSYLKKGEDNRKEYYLPSNEANGGQIIKAALADPFQGIVAYTGEQTLCILTVFGMESCEERVSFKREKKEILSNDSFQQTLIYSGKVGSKINIGYREFSGNMARPAFNNEVEYDLTQSKIIGYKGARLEIIEATNEYIKYKVLNNFNKVQ